MKKILYTLLLVGGFCLSANAQVQNSRQATNVKETSFNEKMTAVRSCEELNEQLTKLFGKNYTIADAKVMAQLQKNIADKNASRCIRKKSLYGVYGEDYVNKVYLINDDGQISNSKK